MYTKRNIIEIQNMTRIALCTAILCVSSYLVIPLPFTPIVFSMQTVMVNLIGLILKPKSAALTILMYLCMGMIGLPVFSGGSAGIGKLIGPTGGFYFGFFFAVIGRFFAIFLESLQIIYNSPLFFDFFEHFDLMSSSHNKQDPYPSFSAPFPGI